jgi:Lamin Tail Domain
MKPIFTKQVSIGCLIILCMSTSLPTVAQGRLVINEFLNWTGENCPVTSEFIELKNMGPGTLNIGCHVVTEGDFAITIPPNTFLGPGEFYVLGGQDQIEAPCANINRNIAVDLNWNSCGCTSNPIPVTGEGLMTDGGAGSEQIVLLNPLGQVIDAVVRKISLLESASTLTANNGGSCPTFSFDLDLLGISYEEIGESAGRGNSFARKLDGSCVWLKETQQSGGESNDKIGDLPAMQVQTTITLNAECQSGNALLTITNANPTSYFPLAYMLAFDGNRDGIFDESDPYSSGQDNTPPSVNLQNIVLGKYNILLEPANGCNQQLISFDIGPCVTLHSILYGFKAQSTQDGIQFSIDIDPQDWLMRLSLQGSSDGIIFRDLVTLPWTLQAGRQDLFKTLPADSNRFYRLALNGVDEQVNYSSVIQIRRDQQISTWSVTPNPIGNNFHLLYNADKPDLINVKIFSATERLEAEMSFRLHEGRNSCFIPANTLPKGIHLILVENTKKQLIFHTRIAKY